MHTRGSQAEGSCHGGGVRVRAAIETDVEEIAEAHVESWWEAYTGLIPDWFIATLSVDRRIDTWRQAIADAPPRSGTFVLEDDAEPGRTIVGFAHFRESRDEDAESEHLGELTSIYVRKVVWGQGGGTTLIRQVTAAMRAHGFTEATLWVLETNQRARRFYEARGWKLDGGRKTDSRPGITFHDVRYRRPLME